MRLRPQAVGLLLFALLLAVPAWAQQKPFTQEQVQGLVRDGIGDDNGARLITQRGIDFEPTEDFLESLKSAGAGDAFLRALRAAKRPEAAENPTVKPLTEVQIVSLISGEVPSERVAQLVGERGIDFEPDEQFFTQLRAAGGDDDLIATLRSAKVIKPKTAGNAADIARQSDVREHTYRAAEYLQKKKYPEAVSEYQTALQLDPQNPELHVSLGNALGRTGDWAGQVREEREAIQLNPGNDRAHLNLGVALSHQDDQQGAISEYREAIRLNPNNDQAHTNLGNRLSHMGDQQGAMAEYREAVRLNPKGEQPRAALAGMLLRNKDYDGAIAQYREGLDLNPKSDTLHVDLGVVYSQKGDQDAALAEYREAIRLNPMNEQAHTNLGNRLYGKQDWDGAAAEYNEAIRLNPRNAPAHYGLGMSFERRSDRQSALQEYRTAAGLDPKNAMYQKAADRLGAAGSP